MRRLRTCNRRALRRQSGTRLHITIVGAPKNPHPFRRPGKHLSFKAAIARLQKAFAPVFAEQQAVEQRELPAAMARAARLGITIDTIGGNCPVQAEGGFDDTRFYFRARGDDWQFHVGLEEARFTDAEWTIESDWGEGPYDAGWMPKHEAVGLICDGVERYRQKAATND